MCGIYEGLRGQSVCFVCGICGGASGHCVCFMCGIIYVW